MKSSTLGGHQCGVSLARMLTCPYTVPLSSCPEPAHNQVDPKPGAENESDAERYSTRTQPMVDEPADESPKRHTGDQVSQRGPPDIRRGPFVATSSGLLVTGHDARTISVGLKRCCIDPRGARLRGWPTSPAGLSGAGHRVLLSGHSARGCDEGSKEKDTRALRRRLAREEYLC